MNRRQFYRYAAGAAGAAALASMAHAEEKSPTARIRRPLCVSSYSYWGYRTEAAPTMEQCVIWASEMGFVGLEILEKQMYLNPAAGEITESKLPGGGQLFQTYRTNRAYLKNLKRFAFTQGIALCGYATHQSFVTPDEEEYERIQNEGTFEFFSRPCIARLNRFAKDFPVSIVISSSWRFGGLDYCKEYLKDAGLEDHVVFTDTTSLEVDGPREELIMDYLLEHPDFTGFLIFDDIHMSHLLDYLVQTDVLKGWDEECDERARKIIAKF